MLGTLLDVSASSRARFAREIVALARSGLRMRGLESARLGARRVIADGFCLAALWMLTLFLSSDLGLRIQGGEPGYPDAALPLWSLALLGVAILAAAPARACDRERAHSAPASPRSRSRVTRYFTAPATIARTRWRWKMRYTPTTGSEVIRRPAISAG
jgi:hypothetical protein